MKCKVVKSAGCSQPMPARRMRVELFDGDGNRYSISFEGQITRDKALRLLDLVELLGGMPPSPKPNKNAVSPLTQLTKFDKVIAITQKHFPLVWFSSREVQVAYENELKEPIPLSTVATYLARMVTRGRVLKTGNSNNLRYRVSPSELQTAINQRTP